MMSKGWFFSLGEQLAANGWDVVLPDLRAHGASGGKYVTWGAKDKRDIKTVVDKLLAEEIIEPKLYAMGASLGGCVAIQYAAFDTRCQGVLALAPPTGVNGVAGELAGFDATDASAIDAAGKLKCPLILAHGRLDIIVPHNHSEQIYQAASGPKKLISLPLTNHVTVQVGQSGWIVRQMSDPARCRWSH
jgi:alpha-beta hydrolase superfamily lysophospholipase